MTCGFAASDGHQAASAQDSLGVGGDFALGVAAPALRDGVSTPLVQLHLGTESKLWVSKSSCNSYDSAGIEKDIKLWLSMYKKSWLAASLL